ncbi:polyphosphate kinase 1 [Niabella insulamsoli]|uniref:polyphosphate kinase 1 n=1 Tax=Niabella insulamsoli TaxID=3144874 RepID=UPI0031FC5C7A
MATYLNRDISWLSFNGRVLQEAARQRVPLLERINFLSIYSSNLDEFYRVRIPALMALEKIDEQESVLQQANERISRQLNDFGKIINDNIIPDLQQHQVCFVYNKDMPDAAANAAHDYFFTTLLAYLHILPLEKNSDFFPENNTLYFLAVIGSGAEKKHYIINIPAAPCGRFFYMTADGVEYVLFIDDIIRHNLGFLFPDTAIEGAYSFKITRDAELDIKDEYKGNLAEKIEKEIAKRDFGFATRCLYDPSLAAEDLEAIKKAFNLFKASWVAGGRYHNLRDLAAFAPRSFSERYPAWPGAVMSLPIPDSLLKSMEQKDLMLHTPYQRYEEVLRFFNEAATEADVEEIYLTFYRIAGDSRIANALISAANNGKKVTVFVELKARFDEANNIFWSKKMKQAGIKIIYSIPGLKVHAKIALVKKRKQARLQYYGLLSTGNFNESTARFYTDHILFTTNPEILTELEILFLHLMNGKLAPGQTGGNFNHLLVAQFNLQQDFFRLIDREIEHAQQGQAAGISIKLNNLEERKLIDKLYEASRAGVSVRLIVRSICCLNPQIEGQSENIRVKRIVDRYLEHGRLFLFHNNDNHEVYMGSADWMNRNIYRRIEVCFPIRDKEIRDQIRHIFDLQWQDNTQAVWINESLTNPPALAEHEAPVRSQESIYHFIKSL